VDQRSVVWDAANSRHIERDHPERAITREEVTEALNDPDRLESIAVRSGVDYHEVLGLTRAGRLLFVVWVHHPDGRYPVHARRAGRKAAGRYYR
jgi:uncharacterized protein YidB (DUF937 family)